MAQEKIKLVVIDEHTLGYIFPELPNSAGILRASILRGSNFNDMGGSISLHGATVRLASEKDFDDYRVVFDGYKNSPEYEYEENCIVQNN
ncbi:MAG: hypothetical protein ABGX00_00820 [Allomuricauda sp.]|uniref:hypothetical protein n=1 Tax=Sinomicrobium oceani TaxID=1150368 RepID=UPI00227C9DD6|nr:hypothetical protein [Sinomicrobium oceani]|tara:strand:+ start:2394 stop:2663 length:270 start_codon:yes stop_codon:yes gene_type:complete